MGLLGTIVGGIGSIFGGSAASRAMNKVSDNLDEQKRENQDWYDMRMNEDATQRADAQRLLQRTEESIRKRNRQAAGTAAVMGGTDESLAAQREANSQALADVTGQIAASADARKDAIEQQFLQRKDNINKQMNDLQMAKAGHISNAIKGVTSAAGNLPI